MKPWPPDRSTMQGLVFGGALLVERVDLGNAPRSILDIPRDQRQLAAVGRIWLRSVTNQDVSLAGIGAGQD